MHEWRQFFWSLLLSPRRFFIAVGLVLFVIASIWPAVGQAVVDRFVKAAKPLIGVVAMVLLIGLAFRIILGMVRRK